MIAESVKRKVSSKTLPWSPPSLTSPRVVDVTNDNTGNRVVELDPNEDCDVRFLEPVGYSPVPFHPAIDASLTVVGGRHVRVIGAQFNIDSHPETVLTSNAASDASSLVVSSTFGFPDSGILRVRGEGIRYSSKTETSFIIAERNFGYFNGVGNPPLSFVTGEKVFIGEQWRGGLSFRNQTGFVHVEGALIEGASLIDGIRVRGSLVTTATIQNSRIGPLGPTDTVTMEDGHADGIQTWGGGVKLLRMSHLSILSGANGRGMINSANTSGGGAVERIVLQDSEFVDFLARRQSLITNSDTATSWQIANAWLRTTRTTALAAPGFGDVFLFDAPKSEYDLVPRDGLGIGYVSPGYN